MEKIKDALGKAKSKTSGFTKEPVNIVKSASNKLPELSDVIKSIIYTKTAVVGLDPVHLEDNRIVAQNNNDPTGWIFDTLRTQVLQIMEENNWRSLAIISPTQAAGKTTVAVNLAISIAKQPQKTAMLVDFDLRRPNVAKYLGIKHEKSLNDYLSSNTDLSEIIVNPNIPHLTIIATNKPVKMSSETLSSTKIQKLVIELKERYDSRIVIFDLPPILSADDAMVLLPLVDCALLVLGDGLHSESEITQTMRLLSKSNILGAVVNRAEVEHTPYYY
jgi:protein-tyrosine kinase